MVQDTLQRAINAFKAGRKDEARTLFMDVVEQDQHNEQAWLYLSALVDTLEEQQICLENVLTVNPNHEKAKQGLAKVQQKLAAQDDSTDAPADSSPPAPPPSFGGSSAPIGAEFADASGDSVFGDASASNSSAFDSGFGGDFDFGADSNGFEANNSNAATFDSFAADPPASDDPFSWMADTDDTVPEPASPASASFGESSTSVDWGSDDQPAVYGSGRQIEEPDYDNWMQNLPIGDNAPSVDAPTETTFGDSVDSADAPSPFGDASYMVDEEMVADSPFGELAADDQFDDSPWDTPDADQPGSGLEFGAEPASVFDGEDDQFGFETPNSFDSGAEFVDDSASAESSLFGTFDFGNETVDSASTDAGDSGFDFSFDDEPAPKSGGEAATPARPAAEYYQQIPGEIEPLAGGITRRSVMLMGGILVMLALNAVSVLMLLI